jgi:hypothetical protein
LDALQIRLPENRESKSSVAHGIDFLGPNLIKILEIAGGRFRHDNRPVRPYHWSVGAAFTVCCSPQHPIINNKPDKGIRLILGGSMTPDIFADS